MDILMTCLAGWTSGLSPPYGEADATLMASRAFISADTSQQPMFAFAGLLEQFLRLSVEEQGRLAGLGSTMRESEPGAPVGAAGKERPASGLDSEDALLASLWQGMLLPLVDAWRPSLVPPSVDSDSSEGRVRAVGGIAQLDLVDAASAPIMGGTDGPPASVGAALWAVNTVNKASGLSGKPPTEATAAQGAPGRAEGRTDLVRFLSWLANTNGEEPPAGIEGQVLDESSRAAPSPRQRPVVPPTHGEADGQPEAPTVESPAQFEGMLDIGGDGTVKIGWEMRSNPIREVAVELSQEDEGAIDASHPANEGDTQRVEYSGRRAAAVSPVDSSGEPEPQVRDAAFPSVSVESASETAIPGHSDEGVDPSEGLTREPYGDDPVQPTTHRRVVAMEGSEGESASGTHEADQSQTTHAASQRNVSEWETSSNPIREVTVEFSQEDEGAMDASHPANEVDARSSIVRVAGSSETALPGRSDEGVDPSEGLTREPLGDDPVQPTAHRRVVAMVGSEGESASGTHEADQSQTMHAASQRNVSEWEESFTSRLSMEGDAPVAQGPAASHPTTLIGAGETQEAPEAARPANPFAVEFVSRVAGDLSRLAILGQNRAVLQLHPPELGHMNVRLSLGAEGLTVQMTVQSMEVKAIVESNLGQLQSALAEQGLQAASLWVQVGQESDQRSRSWAFRKDALGKRRSSSASPEVETIGVANPNPTLRSQYSTLEYWI